MNTELDTPPHADGYMMLFRGTQWEHGVQSTEQLQEIMDGVTAWFERLNREGKVAGARPLLDALSLFPAPAVAV